MINFEMDKEEKDKLISKIKSYFLNERDEEIGDLQSMILLDFFLDLVGKSAYNKGLDDAKSYIEEKLDDMYGLYE